MWVKYSLKWGDLCIQKEGTKQLSWQSSGEHGSPVCRFHRKLKIWLVSDISQNSECFQLVLIKNTAWFKHIPSVRQMRHQPASWWPMLFIPVMPPWRWYHGSSGSDLQSERQVPIAFVVKLFKATDIGLIWGPPRWGGQTSLSFTWVLWSCVNSKWWFSSSLKLTKNSSDGLQMGFAVDKRKSIPIMSGVPCWIGWLSRKIKYCGTIAKGVSQFLALWKWKAINYVTVTYMGWGWCSALEKVISSVLIQAEN